MLEDDHVPLPRLVAELLDHQDGQIVEGGALRDGERPLFEEPQPFQARNDGRAGLEAEPDGDRRPRVGAGCRLGKLPHEAEERRAGPVFRGVVEEPQLDHLPDGLAPAGIAERPPEDGLRLGNAVDLPIGNGIPVGIAFELAEPGDRR